MFLHSVFFCRRLLGTGPAIIAKARREYVQAFRRLFLVFSFGANPAASWLLGYVAQATLTGPLVLSQGGRLRENKNAHIIVALFASPSIAQGLIAPTLLARPQ